MNGKRCDICGGARVIRLPVRHEVALTPSADVMPSDTAIYARTYPCPQCAVAGIDSDQLAIISVGAEQEHYWHGPRPPEMMEHIKRSTARRMADQLVSDGLIAFRVRDEVRGMPEGFTVTAKLGAVSPARVATFEERVIAHQEKTAQDLATLAIEKIANWGSEYTGNEGPIHKAQAISSVRDALDEIRKRKPD